MLIFVCIACFPEGVVHVLTCRSAPQHQCCV